MLALMFSVPRAYERIIPVDPSAALFIYDSEPENVGELLVECLNHHNEFGVWWDLTGADYLKAHEDLGGAWSPSYYIITGRLGWHVTWATIIPLKTETFVAYETFGAENSLNEALFRVELPTRIIGSLKRCGVAFDGVYPDELPFNG